jgi:predicted permease
MVEIIGFSTIGIEFILFVIIPIFCISIIGYLLFKKKLKITEKQKKIVLREKKIFISKI